MARFNPQDYETVDERTRRFYNDHPTGRIGTEIIASQGDIGKTRWVVQAQVYRDTGDEFPAGIGHAFEVDGTGGANGTSALENCETSAIGRALAAANYSGNKRATREEMKKFLVGEFKAKIMKAKDKTELQALWGESAQQGLIEMLHNDFKRRGEELHGGQNASS